jgi:hypothetical protein
MGLVRGIIGHASETDAEKLEQEFAPMLTDGEEITKAYKLIRDLFVFTNKRLILVDKQGVTGKKKEYHAIPYRSIVRFSKESKGVIDLDAELKLWIFGEPQPIVKHFSKTENVNDVYRVLSEACLR